MNLFQKDQSFLCQNLNETRTLAVACAGSLAARQRLILLFDGEMGAGKTQFIRFLLEAMNSLSVVESAPLSDADSRLDADLESDLEIDAEPVGGNDSVTSPSFAIHNRYDSAFGAVDHMDLYRLESEDDLESTGFWDLFLEPSGCILIEWACRLGELGLMSSLPKTWPKFQFNFEIRSATSREISIRRIP